MSKISENLSRRAILAGASAIPIAACTSAAASADDVSFPDLVARFVHVRGRYHERKARDEVHSRLIDLLLNETTGMTEEQRNSINVGDPRFDQLVKDINEAYRQIPDDDPVDEHGGSIAWTEISDEMSSVSEAMLGQVPRSAADLAWQAEALVISDCEILYSDHAESMCQLFRNIFALAKREFPEHLELPDEAQS
jgi:hypothetical protein